MQDGAIWRLEGCPVGYKRISQEGKWAQQECSPCDSGTECVDGDCDTCTDCGAGKFKDAAGTQACTACSDDTYASTKTKATRPDGSDGA